MLTATILEQFLRAVAESDVGIASAEDAAADDREAAQIIREAYERLKAHPGLRSGDPDANFTYEDPILAVVAYASRFGPQMREDIGHAQARDQNLKNLDVRSLESAADYLHLAKNAVLAWFRRGNLAWKMLGSRVPSGPVAQSLAPLRLAIVGDAGGRGSAQDRVFQLMRDCHDQRAFHWVIHLGDTYFGASEAEMIHNLLNPLCHFRNAGAKVATLCGNHDLYYGPAAFDAALNILGQPGRYFCLENSSWRIACLDTSLACERIMRNEGKLDDGQDGQLEWLDKLLAQQDGKRLILLSHHCILSGWDQAPSPPLAAQLRDRVRGRVFAWYWGHEHRCATYGRGAHGFYGACIGNGVWLEEWSPQRILRPDEFGHATWYPDGRCNCYCADGPRYWPHGFLELELAAGRLTERFHLEDGSVWQRQLSEDSPLDAGPNQESPPPGPVA